MEHGRQQADLP